MAEKNMTIHKDTVPTGREELWANKNYLRPSVDIFETEEALTLVADMPGVDREHLDINLEKGILTLKGTAEPTGKGEKIFREFSLAGYYRQFQLSDLVDSAKTTAELKNGVLTLTMPKAEAAKPRRIEIRQ